MNRRGTTALLTLAVLSASTTAFAGDGPNGVPYAVFDAINELWAAVRAIQLTPGPAGPQGLRGERGLPGEGALRVVDSNGQTVGAFLAQDVPTVGYQHLAVAKAGSQLVFLLVNRNGFRDNYVSSLYHTTPDCTGQRYLAMGNSPYVIRRRSSSRRSRPPSSVATQSFLTARSPWNRLRRASTSRPAPITVHRACVKRSR